MHDKVWCKKYHLSSIIIKVSNLLSSHQLQYTGIKLSRSLFVLYYLWYGSHVECLLLGSYTETSRLVDEHLGCACQCSQTADSCLKTQFLNPGLCQCECLPQNQEDVLDCPQKGNFQVGCKWLPASLGQGIMAQPLLKTFKFYHDTFYQLNINSMKTRLIITVIHTTLKAVVKLKPGFFSGFNCTTA